MLSFLPAPIVGVITGFLFFLNILIMAFLVIIVGVIRFLVPFQKGRDFLSFVQHDVITPLWSDFNTGILKFGTKIKWVIEAEGQLKKNHWYFVFANHQTWADIVVMQQVFNRKIPLLKFFLKKELLWSLPIGGIACWMLDYPVMQRHTKAYLKKHPEKRNADVDTTRAACQKFKERPTAIMNFLEGTRFTEQKQKDRSSPYKHLLRPKAGGLAFVISELRGFIQEAIDVTIIYGHKDPSFWRFISGQIPKITVHYRVIPLSESQIGDYYNDPSFRKSFQGWVNSIWQHKDSLIATHAKEQAV